jgi:hypothetical protein
MCYVSPYCHQTRSTINAGAATNNVVAVSPLPTLGVSLFVGFLRIRLAAGARSIAQVSARLKYKRCTTRSHTPPFFFLSSNAAHRGTNVKKKPPTKIQGRRGMPAAAPAAKRNPNRNRRKKPPKNQRRNLLLLLPPLRRPLPRLLLPPLRCRPPLPRCRCKWGGG